MKNRESKRDCDDHSPVFDPDHTCHCEEDALSDKAIPYEDAVSVSKVEIASGWVSTPHLRWLQVYAAKNKSAATQPPALAMTGD